MDKILPTKGRGIKFWWSVQEEFSTPLMKTVDYDDEENLSGCGHDEDDDDDEDDETPVSALGQIQDHESRTAGGEDGRGDADNPEKEQWQHPGQIECCD